MIELNNISKTYTNGKKTFKAIDNISLSISKGEFIAITGPSGAGKSTLLHILGLMDSASSGSFTLNNRNVTEFDQKARAQLRNKDFGFVLQNFGLVDDWSVIKNVKIPLLYSKTTKKEINIKAENVLKQLGVYTKCNELVKNLSGGQKQRVAIARAIINEPQIILADEPTGSLDRKNSEEVMRIFKELNKTGVTVIVVTHDLFVSEFCDKEIKMIDGKIVCN